MRRSFGLTALLALLGPLAVTAATPVSDAVPPAAAVGGEATNTIVVITDDMRADEMRVLPATRHWLADRGVRYANAYAPTALCCPARATILTGQYAHNTGVYDNHSGGTFPGGFEAFDDSQTIATELESAGITTGYIGKYLNQYTSAYVPPGWDEWHAGVQSHYQYRHRTLRSSVWRYRGRTVYNINGEFVTKRGYETNVQTRMAIRFIRNHADKQFFLELNWLAPHGNVDLTTPGVYDPPIPHESHEHDFDGYRVPRSAAFNEAHVRDKPLLVQRPLMTSSEMAFVDRLGEARMEALKSVDDGMIAIRAALRAEGIEGRTNVLFVSDNGFMLGEHRMGYGKNRHYEPSSRVPLLMAGPDVQRSGVVRAALVGLHDIAPTVTSWFGLDPMPGADGRPLVGADTTGRDILLQGSSEGDQGRHSYTGLRTDDGYKYVEYLEGEVELYDLDADPLEVRNRADDPAYAALRADLAHRLATLRFCAEQTCR